MKITRRLIALFVALLLFLPLTVFAEETDPTAEPAAPVEGAEEPAAEGDGTEEPPAEEPAAEEELPYDEFLNEIAEDSELLPIKDLMNSITTQVVTDENGESTLVISFTNPELFEGDAVSEEALAELEANLNSRIASYLASIEEPEEAPTEEPDADPDNAPTEDPDEGDGTEEPPAEDPPAEGDGTEEPPAEDPPAEGDGTEEPPAEDPPAEGDGTVELPADAVFTIEIPLGSGLTEGQIADILLLADTETGKLFITESFDSVKDAFFQAKVDYINAMNAYKEARKNGTLEEELAAFEALVAAREYKEEMEELKDAVEEMKDGIEDLLETDLEGFGKGRPEENPSIMNKLESNGIGKGLIKGWDTEEENDEEDPEDTDEEEPEDDEDESKGNNGKGNSKDKKEKSNNGKNGR